MFQANFRSNVSEYIVVFDDIYKLEAYLKPLSGKLFLVGQTEVKMSILSVLQMLLMEVFSH